MLANRHRFHGHKSVTRVRGSKAQSTDFTLYYKKGRPGMDFRMAVVVSKKVAKSAVVRNRIRRRLYESVRKQRLLDGHAVDLVFVVRNESLAGLPATELDMQVARVCAAAAG